MLQGITGEPHSIKKTSKQYEKDQNLLTSLN